MLRWRRLEVEKQGSQGRRGQPQRGEDVLQKGWVIRLVSFFLTCCLSHGNL